MLLSCIYTKSGFYSFCPASKLSFQQIIEKTVYLCTTQAASRVHFDVYVALKTNMIGWKALTNYSKHTKFSTIISPKSNGFLAMNTSDLKQNHWYISGHNSSAGMWVENQILLLFLAVANCSYGQSCTLHPDLGTQGWADIHIHGDVH